MGAVSRGFGPECCVTLFLSVLLTPRSLFVLLKDTAIRPLLCFLGTSLIFIVGVAYFIICFVAAVFLFIVLGRRLEPVICFYVCVILFSKEFFQK